MIRRCRNFYAKFTKRNLKVAYFFVSIIKNTQNFAIAFGSQHLVARSYLINPFFSINSGYKC